MPDRDLTALVALVGITCSSGGALGASIVQPVDWATLQLGGEIRQALSWRIERQDAALLGDAGLDDGNRNFSRGLVSSRTDAFAEVDANLWDLLGVRVSAAAWYDHLYERRLDHSSVATSNHLNGQGQPAPGLSGPAKRFAGGPDIELLDASVSAVFDLGQMPASIKVGRFSELSGEALFASGAIHGVSYGQAPLDIAKAVVSPGARVDELFLPLNSLLLEIEPIDGWALGVQYTPDWAPYRLPEAGVYLGANDAIQEGGESIILADGSRLVHRRDQRGARGGWSLGLSYFPRSIDGIFRLHFREFSDVLPQVAVDSDPPDSPDCASPEVPDCRVVGQYRFLYPNDVRLIGMSFSAALGSLSLGVDFNARFGMPLVSDPSLDAVAGIPDLGLATVSDILLLPAGLAGQPQAPAPSGAKGDTLHLVVNIAGFASGAGIADGGLFDDLAYALELSASSWLRVEEREDLFRGRADYQSIDRVSKENLAIALRLEPAWSTAWTGLELSAPISASAGLAGNSAVLFGGNKGDGNYAAGLALKAQGRYSVELRYSDFFGRIDTDSTGVAIQTSGAGAALSDRGVISLLFRARW